MGGFSSFRVYRYQLLPLDRNKTKDLFTNISPEEIIEQKNYFFEEALSDIQKSMVLNSKIIVSLTPLLPSFFSLTFAPSRPLTRETPNSQLEKVDNWPHITTYVLNAPDDQYLLIQDRAMAFGNTDTVANLIKKYTKQKLEKLGLSLHIETLFNEAYFWNLINEYKNKVTRVEFEFITPNMANISKTLADTLKSLGKETNAVEEELTLTSDSASSLDIFESNDTVKGLVEYTSEGGGDIKLKIRGIRKKFHTSKSVREVSLSGLELTASPNEIIKIIKEALK